MKLKFVSDVERASEFGEYGLLTEAMDDLYRFSRRLLEKTYGPRDSVFSWVQPRQPRSQRICKKNRKGEVVIKDEVWYYILSQESFSRGVIYARKEIEKALRDLPADKTEDVLRIVSELAPLKKFRHTNESRKDLFREAKELHEKNSSMSYVTALTTGNETLRNAGNPTAVDSRELGSNSPIYRAFVRFMKK